MRPHVLCRAVGGPGTRIDESEVSSLSANSHTQRHGRRRRRDLDVDAGDAHAPATAEGRMLGVVRNEARVVEISRPNG